MFDVLVLPILLYASEETGLSRCEEYERCQRRHQKWTLGLPKGTPNGILRLETGVKSIRQGRMERTIKYTGSATGRKSNLLRAVMEDRRRTLETYGNKDLNRLEWSVEEVYRKEEDAGFWRRVGERVGDQEKQLTRAEADHIQWYMKPVRSRAIYI